MELNKTLMIAALVAGSMFATDVAVHAQNATNRPPAGARPGPRGQINFDAISKRLALTDDQAAKAKPVFQEMAQKLADLRKDKSVQGADRRAKIEEIRDAVTAKLKDILTPEQLGKWQNMGPRNRPTGAGAPPGGNPQK